MPAKKAFHTDSGAEKVIAEARRHRKQQETTYRQRALALYAHVCGRCGREFEGKKLRELTVHHKDHNHDNNPPDGSNWELLCLYCHENEHDRQKVAEAYEQPTPDAPDRNFESLDQPFAALANLLKDKKN